MATKRKQETDPKMQPLQNRDPKEDQVPVGGEHVVNMEEGTASQEYSVPGTPNAASTGFVEDQESSREHEAHVAEVDTDTGVAEREANRGLVVHSASPEVNYASRDNIVYPDPRPEKVALVEAVAEYQGVANPRVEVDNRDLAVHEMLSGREAAVPEDYRDQVDSHREDAAEAVRDGRITLAQG